MRATGMLKTMKGRECDGYIESSKHKDPFTSQIKADPMSGHQNHSNTLVSSSSSTSQASNVNVSLRGVLNPETKRLPLLKGAETPAKFDKQVEVLPIRFQAMTRITPADTTTESRSRPGLQRSIDDADDDRMDEENPRHRESGGGLHRSARKSSANGDQKRLETDSERATYIEQPIGLVVALFHDGFVCRHINKENEGVEGFAQPYDAESSYFLACIDNGRVPEGLPDMIACAHNNGSVLAEIRDYRDMRAALCPVSSAFLPAASALLQADAELDEGCHVWQTLLLPGKSPLPFQAQVSSLFEPPTLQSIFDHFPDVTPSELETLAMDAKQQLLQEKDVLLSSSSTDSSSPRDDTRGFGGLPTEPQEIPDRSVSGTTTTPTTRSHLHSDLGSSPPASLLSPITRKSARSSLSGQEDTIAKPCKRQIQTSAKGGLQHRRTDHANSILSVRSQSPGMEICTSPRCFRSDPSQQSYSEVLVDDAAPVTPLPATQLFLSKLKGKRRRPDNELLYGKPAWVTIAHVGRFYRAATRLEREHSRFLHANARKLMQAEKALPAETEHVAGSMRYLARQLGDLTRPSDVVAVACARELKVAKDEGRKLHEADWMETEERSSSPTWRSPEVSIALVSQDKDPSLHLRRIDKDEDILLGQFFEIAPDPTSLPKDIQPTAAAPHFNAFDDDGNLQVQSA